MSSVINVLLPIFGLILAGYIGRRTRILGDTAAAELNRFVVWFCLPSLLFHATATASWKALWHPHFIAVNAISTLFIFAVTAIWRHRSGQNPIDAVIDGLSTAYPNTGYVGIPLCVLVLGEPGLAPALIATLIVVCVIFAAAIVVVEICRHRSGGLWQPLVTVARALARNPIVVAPVIGILWSSTGFPVVGPIAKFIQLLGAATTPCALVSIGAFLARPVSTQSATRGIGGMVGLKLIAHPILTTALALWVFPLDKLWITAAVLLTALPTGTGPYMLADFYQRDLTVASRVILFTTLGSVFTLGACLILLPR